MNIYPSNKLQTQEVLVAKIKIYYYHNKNINYDEEKSYESIHLYNVLYSSSKLYIYNYYVIIV